MLLAIKKKTYPLFQFRNKKIFLINHWDYDINIVSKCNKNKPLFYGFFFIFIFHLNKRKIWLIGRNRKKKIDQEKLLINNQYKQVGGTYCFLKELNNHHMVARILSIHQSWWAFEFWKLFSNQKLKLKFIHRY